MASVDRRSCNLLRTEYVAFALAKSSGLRLIFSDAKYLQRIMPIFTFKLLQLRRNSRSDSKAVHAP
jgi:hypothetical protein